MMPNRACTASRGDSTAPSESRSPGLAVKRQRDEKFMRNRTITWIVLLIACGQLVAQVPGQPGLNVAHPLPPQAPPWVEGYQFRWPVRILGEIGKQAEAQTVLVRLSSGGWLKPDGSDITVQTGSGKILPVAVLSHDPLGGTIVQFPRNGLDPWYWIYGGSSRTDIPRADPKTLREGITLELRDWQGDDLTSWAKVRAGLEKSTSLLGNAIVGDVMQNCCPARPEQSNKFAASYRGYFRVPKEATYRFVVTADDASFLFIDGFKVCERPGVNRTIGTIKVKELEQLAGKVDLKAGVHEFELHQAVSAKPEATGVCALLWSPPEQPKFSPLPHSAAVLPLYARVAALEKPGGERPGLFVCGLDDSLEIPGIRLFLVRFEAQGPAKDEKSFVWDFGDGTAVIGRTVTHVYFKEGDYTVALSSESGLPPFRQRVHVWAEPCETSPFSLERAVDALAALEWKKLNVERVRSIFTFLLECEQPGRWRLLDEVAQHLLQQKDFDLEFRSQLCLARMEALTQQNHGADALKLAEQVRPEFAKTPALLVRILLGTAAIHQYHYRDAAAASKIYKSILDEHSRTEHPNLRLAGIRWGDLLAESGDLVRADEAYRTAATLGGEKFGGTATTDAATRGALLRIAEQKLRAGEIQATRQLLERLEMEYPGRRLDGLYCFLRAESDRFAGRYEEAMRNYEMIFKLPQWAGYRDRATHGIADCYLRMGTPGDLSKAAKWFADLKDNHTKYYETQKLAEVDKLLHERLDRIEAARTKGDAGAAFFREFTTGFEPDEQEWFGDLMDFASVRAPGIQGPHAALFDTTPRDLANFNYLRPLRNLTPGETYWLEVWFQDVVRPSPPLPYQLAMLQITLTAETDPKLTTAANLLLPRNSHHQWHKVGIRIKAPMAQDCNLKIIIANMTGVMLFDRLSIRPISDRQADSLSVFLQGGKAP
jgi:tetratricopeptide (TPR) repeat protein